MKNKISKTIYRVFLIASFIAINALILAGIGSVLSYLNTGADKSSILHLEVPMEKVYAPKLTWDSIENPGRPMEKQTLKEIERDYLNAWHVRNIAYKKNDSYGIADFYTDSARQKLIDIIDLNLKSKTRIETTTLEHRPQIDFYSEDGTLVVLTDKHVERYQEVYKEDKLLNKQKETSSYQLMMLLEDGFWRIRHLQQLENISKDTSASINRKIEKKLSFINNLKGINYYPQKTPWDTFGKAFNDTILRNDFQFINKMGLNTIRIFVQYEDFGKADIKPIKLEKLKSTLDYALEMNLKVIITLFDFYGDYDLSNWTLTQRHAETIVSTLKDHEALLGWDIKNEPDLDFDSRGQEKVLSWLNEMLSKIKQWDDKNPITIGWSNPEAAVHLSDKVDYVSYHYYKEPKNFLEAHNKIKSQVKQKPIVLQEYGYSSYDGLWNFFRGGINQQAAYYHKMQNTLTENEIPYIFWTLYDFEEVPASVAGKFPWRTRKQKYFGFINIEGNKKLVFDILIPF